MFIRQWNQTTFLFLNKTMYCVGHKVPVVFGPRLFGEPNIFLSTYIKINLSNYNFSILTHVFCLNADDTPLTDFITVYKIFIIIIIINYFFSGNYSRLVVYFRFERQIGHHLIQTFAPSSLVVMLSWFSFWLDLDAIPGRVTLLVTCMLTLVTMFTGLRADIPPVAYVKVNLKDVSKLIWMLSKYHRYHHHQRTQLQD